MIGNTSSSQDENNWEILPKRFSEAKKAKSIYYFTGKPCKNGHVVPRWTAGGVCVECSKRHQKDFYHTHKLIPEDKEKMSKFGREYRQRYPDRREQRTQKHYSENREKYIEQTSKWIVDNPEKAAEHRKNYRDTHVEEISESNKQYRKAHKEQYAYYAGIRRAKKLNATPNWLTTNDFKQIEQIYEQAQTLTEQTGTKYVVDHYYPLQGKEVSGLHCPENLRVVTESENARKRNKHPER